MRAASSPAAPRAGAAAGGRPAAAPLLDQMAAERQELVFRRGDTHAIGACMLDGAQCWTAARLDGLGVLTEGSAAALGAAIGRDLAGRPAEVAETKDWLLDRVRAHHLGHAIVAEGDGYRAHQGGRQWPAQGHPPAGRVDALSALLAGAAFEDQRARAHP